MKSNDEITVPPPEPVYVIPLPGRETEFRIMSENEVVSPPTEIGKFRFIAGAGKLVLPEIIF